MDTGAYTSPLLYFAIASVLLLTSSKRYIFLMCVVSGES